MKSDKMLVEAIKSVLIKEWADYKPASDVFKQNTFRKVLIAETKFDADQAFKAIMQQLKKWAGISGKGDECKFYLPPDKIGKAAAKLARMKSGEKQLLEFLYALEDGFLEDGDGHVKLYIYPLTEGDSLFVVDFYDTPDGAGYEMSYKEDGRLNFDEVFGEAARIRLVEFGAEM